MRVNYGIKWHSVVTVDGTILIILIMTRFSQLPNIFLFILLLDFLINYLQIMFFYYFLSINTEYFFKNWIKIFENSKNGFSHQIYYGFSNNQMLKEKKKTWGPRYIWKLRGLLLYDLLWERIFLYSDVTCSSWKGDKLNIRCFPSINIFEINLK